MNTTMTARAESKTRVPANRSYETWRRDNLAADLQEATQYLEAAIEDEDPKVSLLALKDITEAYGGVGKLAAVTGLNRENLFQLRAMKTSPCWNSPAEGRTRTRIGPPSGPSSRQASSGWCPRHELNVRPAV